MNKTLGARIAELRKEKGLTQEELVEHGAMGKLFELTDVDTLIEIIVK